MKPIEILLVEDNEGDRLLTTEALREIPYPTHVQIVKDGLEALNYLYQKENFSNSITPDIVLLDINLPKLNGFEVLSRIRSSKRLHNLPVVMLSTSTSEEDKVLAQEKKASYFVSKPLEADNFAVIISSLRGISEPVEQGFKN